MSTKDFSKQKILIEKQVFFVNKFTTYTWKEIKDMNFNDDDEFNMVSVEVLRKNLETDEEYNKRMVEIEENERNYLESLTKTPQKKIEKSAGLKKLRRG